MGSNPAAPTIFFYTACRECNNRQTRNLPTKNSYLLPLTSYLLPLTSSLFTILFPPPLSACKNVLSVPPTVLLHAKQCLRKYRVCHHINIFGGRGATTLPLKLSNCQTVKLFLLSNCLQKKPPKFFINHS